jgi:molybdopterin-guanine dinucleotide biosynthesis protein A
MKTGVTGIVLAGGQSTRMGRDKAFVRVEGVPLALRVAHRLRASVDALLVVGHAGNVEALRDLPFGDVEILEDLRPDCGPLMGVYTGLMRAETPCCVFVPCDMPYVRPGLVDRLVAACGTLADVVGSEVEGDGIQPFPLAVHSRATPAVGELLDAGRGSPRALLTGPRGLLLTITDPRLIRSFANLNTPVDVAGASPDAVAR